MTAGFNHLMLNLKLEQAGGEGSQLLAQNITDQLNYNTLISMLQNHKPLLLDFTDETTTLVGSIILGRIGSDGEVGFATTILVDGVTRVSITIRSPSVNEVGIFVITGV